MKIARKYRIFGRVQGVGFRIFAEIWANRLGVSGYVKNCADGTVEVYAIGHSSALEEFKTHLAQGPGSARVDNVQELEEPVIQHYKRFVIESTW